MDGFQKFQIAKKERYLGLIRQGSTRTAAARSSGIDAKTVAKYARCYPDFAREIEEAEIAACEPVENKLREMALNGNITAILVWLYNRSGGRWQDKRVTNKPNPTDDATFKEILKRLEDK